MELLDIYSIPLQATVEYTFFSNAYFTFTKIDRILRRQNKTKFNRAEMKQSICSDHNEIKPETINRNIFGKIHKYLEMKQLTSI